MLDHTDLEARNCFILNAERAGALSLNSSQLLFRNYPFLTWRMRTYRLSIIPKLQWMFNVVHSGTNSRYTIPAASAEDQHCLDKRFLQAGFLLLWRIRSTPFQAVVSRSIWKHPTSITSHNSLQHVTILLNKPDETATMFNTMLSLFSREGLQHKLWTNLFPQTSFQNLPGRSPTDSRTFYE